MKIVVSVPTLTLGGAERLAAAQAREFAARGHEVTLLVIYDSQDFYDAPPGVNVTRLNLQARRHGIIGKIKNIVAIAKALRGAKADIVLAHMAVNVAIVSILLGIKTVFAEHLDLKYLTRAHSKNLVYRFASCIVVLQTEDKARFLSWGYKTRCEVVHNPAICLKPQKEERPPFMQDSNNAVAVGRLVQEKGFDTLLQAWAIIGPACPGWKLSIVGRGCEQKNLEKLISDLKLDSTVTLAGQYKDIANVYKCADLFLMPSRTEGFSLALCEAMACGAPPVVFDCGQRMRLIIKDGHNGIVVSDGDAQSYANAVIQLINNPQKRQDIAGNAAKITERFNLQKHIDDYEALLKDVYIS